MERERGNTENTKRYGERERGNTENTKRYETVIPLGVSSCGRGHPKAVVPPV